jgi:GDP/UDP-N,N'-diacetylbacillosamine 2-epimerase (hydrolysing)
MRKIGIVTGTRAEYGLLKPLMQSIQNDRELKLLTFVTGMHLSPEFGFTFKTIEDNGFSITDKIEILLSSDTSVGLAKSISLAVMGFAESFERFQPDIVVILGDRYESFAAACSALVCKIPIAHIHGGESTEGALDESFRHAITKMSTLHFPSTELYAWRIRCMGENPKNIFCVGAPGIDAIKSLKLLNRNELGSALEWELPREFAICTYHPVTIESLPVETQIRALFRALDAFPKLSIIFTMPNADPGGHTIIKMIEAYTNQTPHRTKAYISLGQLKYLSLLKYAKVMIGNSSSGIIEAPCFKLPVVNIGERQTGRIRAPNVIDCGYTNREIVRAIKKALTPQFVDGIKHMVNPYGSGNANKKMLDILKTIDLNNKTIKKQFFDISNKKIK